MIPILNNTLLSRSNVLRKEAVKLLQLMCYRKIACAVECRISNRTQIGKDFTWDMLITMLWNRAESSRLFNKSKHTMLARKLKLNLGEKARIVQWFWNAGEHRRVRILTATW